MVSEKLNDKTEYRRWAKELVAQMTLEEKVAQMMHDSPAIERLGIPPHNWRNESLHGVARAGIATVFPQSTAIAATWNTDLMHELATVIADEARAKHHQSVRDGKYLMNYGLSFWAPNINIFRDPRWGRGQETYGEDPYLTSRMGVEYIKGLQGDHPKYLKTLATAKHYAVHSGPESLRHSFNAIATKQDLADTYLPAFEASIKEAGSASVMTAYNRTNDEACGASNFLIGDVLRGRWKFDGYVTTDCFAVDDLHGGHGLTKDAPESAAACVNAGADIECGCQFEALSEAVRRGLVTEETITQAVERLFVARRLLGMFEDPSLVPHAQIPIEINDCEAHQKLALRVAQESMVLLKNDGTLPLNPEKIKTIALIGPHAHHPEIQVGNYHGTPSYFVTPLDAVKKKLGAGATVLHAVGCEVINPDQSGFPEALECANKADVIVFVGGLNQILEGEEDQDEGIPEGMMSNGDRTDLNWPGSQGVLIQKLVATGKPVIVVLMNGSPIATNWEEEHAAAIIEGWYGGQEGGQAISDVIFGDYNPAGRLPITFYKGLDDLPDFTDYGMEGKTYRYYEGTPLYPFGHGLSFSTFAYSTPQLSTSTVSDSDVNLTVNVKNTSSLDGDEVVQVYLCYVSPKLRAPKCKLVGFKRVHFKASEEKTVEFSIAPKQFALVDTEGRYVLEAGDIEVIAGGAVPSSPAFSGAKTTINVAADKVLVGASPLDN